jgi:hypothetical protein
MGFFTERQHTRRIFNTRVVNAGRKLDELSLVNLCHSGTATTKLSNRVLNHLKCNFGRIATAIFGFEISKKEGVLRPRTDPRHEIYDDIVTDGCFASGIKRASDAEEYFLSLW